MDNVLHSLSCGFSGGHVQMWKLDHKGGWASKNWCFQTVVLEKTGESLRQKEIKPVNPKGNQPWTFIERTDAEVVTPKLWPPDMNRQPTGKDHDTGKDWGQEEKGETEDKMVWWHHRLNGHEFEQTPGDGKGQGSLACFQSMGSWRIRHNLGTEQQVKPITMHSSTKEV